MRLSPSWRNHKGDQDGRGHLGAVRPRRDEVEGRRLGSFVWRRRGAGREGGREGTVEYVPKESTPTMPGEVGGLYDKRLPPVDFTNGGAQGCDHQTRGGVSIEHRLRAATAEAISLPSRDNSMTHPGESLVSHGRTQLPINNPGRPIRPANGRAQLSSGSVHGTLDRDRESYGVDR